MQQPSTAQNFYKLTSLSYFILSYSGATRGHMSVNAHRVGKNHDFF